MNIRLADIQADALSIMDGARDLASRIEFQSLLPKDDKAFMAAVARIVSLDSVEIWAAEHEGKIVGGIGMLYSSYLWNPELIIADQLFWWCAKDAPFGTARRLIEAVMNRIGERNAIPMFKALETRPNGMEKIYRRFGLKKVETTFTVF
jgi:hypothetical protein